jgi:hypothetical protein
MDETDHGRLKARLRRGSGLKRRGSARILAVGYAFVQNLRQGHYRIAPRLSSAAAVTGLLRARGILTG